MLLASSPFRRWAGAALVMSAAAAGAAIVSCGSASESANGPTFDAGGADGFAPDSGGADASSGLQLRAIVVNASADLGAVRFCVQANVTTPNARWITTAPLPNDRAMPAANFPGVPQGNGALLPALDVPLGGLTFYAIDAELLARSRPTASCYELLGSGPQRLGASEYVTLPEIPASAFAGHATMVLAITGCAADAGAACPQATAELHGVDTALHADPLSAGAQIANLTAVALSASFARFDANGGAVPLGAIAPGTVGPSNAAAVPLPTRSADYLVTGLTLSVAGDASAPLPFSLDTIARTTDPSALASTYFHGQASYVFVVMGDPAAHAEVVADGGPDPGYDGGGLHVLAFPTTPDAGL